MRFSDKIFCSIGNLYYALTHPPEPLSDEYSHALSWEAATQRLEAAGSIPVNEAALKAEAFSRDPGIEVCSSSSIMYTYNDFLFLTFMNPFSCRQISLPPLIEDVEDRKIVASGLRRSRARYRMFRSRLSQEVSQSSGKSKGNFVVSNLVLFAIPSFNEFYFIISSSKSRKTKSSERA